MMTFMPISKTFYKLFISLLWAMEVFSFIQKYYELSYFALKDANHFAFSGQ